VVATNFPLFCFLRSLCDSTDVEAVYLGPEEGHQGELSHWSPDPDGVFLLQSADLIFRNGRGAEFAQWINRISLDETKLISATDAMKLDQFVIVDDYATVHRHGPEGEHTHPSVVTRCWLSPKIASGQVVWCRDQLTKKYPQHKQAFADSCVKLESQLQKLSLRIEAMGKQFEGRQVYCSNPEARYLMREMGLDCISLNWRSAPETKAAVKQLKELVDSEQDMKRVAFVWTFAPGEGLRKATRKLVGGDCGLDLVDYPGTEDDKGYFEKMNGNLDRMSKIASAED